MKNRTWSDQDLSKAVAASVSIAQVIRKLNLAIAGGTYENIKKHIQRLELDTSHFCGQEGKNRFGKSKNLKLTDILTVNSNYASSEIRKFLLRENLIKNECEECGIESWRGNSITIQLHHVNGNRHDHRLENLQMLCPNCHSQK